MPPKKREGKKRNFLSVFFFPERTNPLFLFLNYNGRTRQAQAQAQSRQKSLKKRDKAEKESREGEDMCGEEKVERSHDKVA